MTLYIVVHERKQANDDAVRPPTRLLELARASLVADASPRWLTTWSLDLHDDRIVSLWEAESAAEITAMIERFGFLDDMEGTRSGQGVGTGRRDRRRAGVDRPRCPPFGRRLGGGC
jgi:hypothetical protein